MKCPAGIVSGAATRVISKWENANPCRPLDIGPSLRGVCVASTVVVISSSAQLNYSLFIQFQQFVIILQRCLSFTLSIFHCLVDFIASATWHFYLITLIFTCLLVDYFSLNFAACWRMRLCSSGTDYFRVTSWREVSRVTAIGCQTCTRQIISGGHPCDRK